MKKNYIFNFKKKTIVISGGAGYLGQELVNAFLKLDAKVIILDNFTSNKNKIPKLFKKKLVKMININLEKPEEIKNLYFLLKKKNISIDCLINNAAYVGKKNQKDYTGSLNEQSHETFQNVIDINLSVPFILSKYLSKLMKKSVSPSIINISSIYGNLAPDFSIYKDTEMGNSAAYSSSKSGLKQLTRWLSSYLAPKIRVNSISPGGIFRFQNPKFVSKYKSRVLLKRMANKADVIGPILFLASDTSSYITGIDLIVDGGFSAI